MKDLQEMFENQLLQQRDKRINLKNRLRSRFYHAVKLYSKTGQSLNFKDYGINFEKILNHLGPCPGYKDDWFGLSP